MIQEHEHQVAGAVTVLLQHERFQGGLAEQLRPVHKFAAWTRRFKESQLDCGGAHSLPHSRELSPCVAAELATGRYTCCAAKNEPMVSIPLPQFGA